MARNFGSDTGQSHDFAMVNNNYIPGIASYRSAIPQLQNAQQSSHSRRQMAFGSDIPQMYQSGMQEPSDMGITTNRLHTNSVDSVLIEPPLFDGASYNVLSSQSRSHISVASCNNFTFTTPTQSHVYSPTSTSATTSRVQYTRVTPQTFAPTGCSAQWQHSAPQRRAWLQQNRTSCQQAANTYTGNYLHMLFLSYVTVAIYRSPFLAKKLKSLSQLFFFMLFVENEKRGPYTYYKQAT